jgi:biopolymer transport protein ExbD
MARKKKADDDENTDPNVLPVMNIMFLMIPALLLAMEIAKMAAVAV